MHTTTSAPVPTSGTERAYFYLIKCVISKRSSMGEVCLTTIASNEVRIHPSSISIDPYIPNTAKYITSTHISYKLQ